MCDPSQQKQSLLLMHFCCVPLTLWLLVAVCCSLLRDAQVLPPLQLLGAEAACTAVLALGSYGMWQGSTAKQS